MKRRVTTAGIVALLALVALVPVGAQPLEPPSFPLGVASGEVRSTSVILWAKAARGEVLVEVSTTKNFSRTVFSGAVEAPRSRDRIATVEVTGLESGKRYFYRFLDPEAREFSRVGTFTTAPAPSRRAGVHFAWSGDSDGWTDQDGFPAFNHFQVLDQARYEGAQFFMYLGDTVYTDSAFSPFGPADTLGEYRAAYRQNRTYDALRDLMAAMPVYAHWDDHEVRNDFDRETVDPILFKLGRRAFQEYMPVQAWDPKLGFYRTFRWGKDVQFFILDERSFRSQEVDLTGACDNPPGSGTPDLVPTLPQGIRNLFAQLLPQLATPVPQQCLDALEDPGRTLLGAAQKARFKRDLKASKARFKVVFNEVPIQELFALPYDRWEGYAAERREILDFIVENEIEGVVWLTTDTHANIINDLKTAAFGGTDTGMDEIIVGPIATNPFADEIVSFTGSQDAVGAFELFATGFLGVSCLDIRSFAYGSATYDPKAGTLTIEIKDDTGAPVCPPHVIESG